MTTIHEVQAAAEGVPVDDDHIEFMGQRFRLAESVGLMPLMRFAMTAKKGVQSDDLEGLAAMYAMIKDCIDTTRPQKPVLDEHGQPVIKDGQPVTEDDGPSEWDRFEQHACDTKADADDIFKVVTEAIQRLSARPTRRPAVSSAGPQTTSATSRAISSSRAPDGAGELVDIQDLIGARSIA